MFARISILLAMLVPLFASANEGVPAFTDNSLNGVWEGMVSDRQLVRMDIRPRGGSYLADVYSKDVIGLYRLTGRRVDGRGVFLRFERPNGGLFFPAVITLEGKGSATDNDTGDLRLTLHQLTGDKFSYPLHLRKGTKTHVPASFSKPAELAIPH